LSTHPADDAASSPGASSSFTLPVGAHRARKLGPGLALETLATDTDSAASIGWPAGKDAGATWEGLTPDKFSKRVIDVIGVIALALVFAPLMLIIAVLLRREGGTVLYRHTRIGRGGAPFECLKFRTMVPDAERVLGGILARDPGLRAEWLRDHKLKEDPRVTAIGRLLRRTSLDELPQLWNVLRGEMSLVGPRPVVREELLRYGRAVGVYLSARPGITGLWQVMGRNDTEYLRRVALDVWYVRHQSLQLDLSILARTVLVVLHRTGAY
jgi:undecaprenyl-phosphate galactose phosphotransferase